MKKRVQIFLCLVLMSTSLHALVEIDDTSDDFSPEETAALEAVEQKQPSRLVECATSYAAHLFMLSIHVMQWCKKCKKRIVRTLRKQARSIISS